MKKILVTGAAGFIGFHLAKSLTLRGDKVIGFDNFNDYYNPKLKYERARLLKEMSIPIVEGDICDLNSLKELVEDHGITHIVHLAAQAGVRYSLSHPHTYLKSNVEGFLNILEVCRQIASLKLIYASSSSVYGKNTKVPFSTSDTTDDQASLYGVTKKTNELMANTYHHLYGISTTGLRFFTVYGPWGRPDMAYFSFTKAILEERPIDIFNHGKMQRDFTYIDDIIQGTVAAIDLGADNEIFNLGNHQPVEVLTFVQILEEAIGKKAKKNFLPMQLGDVLTTYADITESQKKLNFTPKTSLSEGLPIFVRWYKECYATLNF